MKNLLKKHYKIIILLIPVMVAAGFVAGVKISDLPAVCGSCHSMKPHLGTWRANIHSQNGVDCMDCHVKPGLFNHAEAHVMAVVPWKEKKSYLKDVYGFHDKVDGFDVEDMSFEGKSEADKKELLKKCLSCHPDRLGESYFLHVFEQNKPVVNANCRRCHTNIIQQYEKDKIENSDIHTTHQDISQCTRCHAYVVHSTHPEDSSTGEELCRRCHQPIPSGYYPAGTARSDSLALLIACLRSS